MGSRALRIVVLGLTITSSWGNGHATTFRGLVRGLARRGHRVLFLERDKPWYAENRDLPQPPYGETALYDSTEALTRRWGVAIRAADLVIVGSYVPDGIGVGEIVQRLATGVTAFYDIDTPVTLAALEAGNCEYLPEELLRGFELYLSFTGGPTLDELERAGAPGPRGRSTARPIPDVYRPNPAARRAGTSAISAPTAQTVSRRWTRCCARRPGPGTRAVRGRRPALPEGLGWPGNVARIEHLAPDEHRDFYAAQRFTLNVTRADMIRRGYSPSVRLFEAACCGVPIISDRWPGLDTFFRPGRGDPDRPDAPGRAGRAAHHSRGKRRAIGEAARARVLASHTADHRAAELEAYAAEAMRTVRRRVTA